MKCQFSDNQKIYPKHSRTLDNLKMYQNYTCSLMNLTIRTVIIGIFFNFLKFSKNLQDSTLCITSIINAGLYAK